MAASTFAISLSLPSSLQTHSPNRILLKTSPNRSPNFSVRSPPVRASVAAAAPLPTSSTGIVLVDRSDAEKPNRLKSVYAEKVVPILINEFSYKNVHEVPKIEKIVVNCGMGDAEQNSKGLEAAMRDLALITGQRPVKTKAKKSIATFKLREGTTVGIAVTLRGNRYFISVRRGLPNIKWGLMFASHQRVTSTVRLGERKQRNQFSPSRVARKARVACEGSEVFKGRHGATSQNSRSIIGRRSPRPCAIFSLYHKPGNEQLAQL